MVVKNDKRSGFGEPKTTLSTTQGFQGIPPRVGSAAAVL